MEIIGTVLKGFMSDMELQLMPDPFSVALLDGLYPRNVLDEPDRTCAVAFQAHLPEHFLCFHGNFSKSYPMLTWLALWSVFSAG